MGWPSTRSRISPGERKEGRRHQAAACESEATPELEIRTSVQTAYPNYPARDQDRVRTEPAIDRTL